MEGVASVVGLDSGIRLVEKIGQVFQANQSELRSNSGLRLTLNWKMTIWNSGRWQRRRENERFIAQKSGPARLFYNLKCAFPSVTSKDTMRGRWERKPRWPIFDIPFGNQLCSLWRGHGNVEDRDKRKRGERGGGWIPSELCKTPLNTRDILIGDGSKFSMEIWPGDAIVIAWIL